MAVNRQLLKIVLTEFKKIRSFSQKICLHRCPTMKSIANLPCHVMLGDIL